jgi:hypothetical protein
VTVLIKARSKMMFLEKQVRFTARAGGKALEEDFITVSGGEISADRKYASTPADR